MRIISGCLASQNTHHVHILVTKINWKGEKERRAMLINRTRIIHLHYADSSEIFNALTANKYFLVISLLATNLVGC